MKKIGLMSIIAVFFTLTLSFAKPEDTESVTGGFLASLHPQDGTITLPNGVAALEVPEYFRYIGPEDTKRLLEEGWGNPDGAGTLGMLLPVEIDPFDEGGWGVVITYQDDGYISDEDAGKINYDELLQSLKAGEQDINEERKKLGFEPITLIGWASPPRYDSQTKKLYWAKELKFGNQPGHTLNYNVRILGRKGVLVMNAISGMEQLPKIEERMKQVISFTEFTKGNKYSDFDPGTDKVAAYGIAALVAGKVAAKVGLFAKLGAVLFAFKKAIAVAVVSFGAFLSKLFKRRKAVTDSAATPGTPEQ